MPCHESLNIDLLRRIERVERRVVTNGPRSAETCGHPVPIDLEPYADLRVWVIKRLTVARVLSSVLEDSVGVAEGLTTRIWSPTVDWLVLCSAFPSQGPILDNRVSSQRDSMNLDESRGDGPVDVGSHARGIQCRLVCVVENSEWSTGFQCTFGCRVEVVSYYLVDGC